MPDHNVLQIRDAALTRLAAITVVPSVNVFTDRVYPLDLYPTLTVLVAKDTPAEGEETAGQSSVAHAKLMLELRHKANVGDDPGLSDTLWNAAAEIASLLVTSGDVNLGAAGATITLEWKDSTVELNGEGEKPAGKLVMEYDATHRYLGYDHAAG